MHTNDNFEFTLSGGTSGIGKALLGAPALREWPPSLEEACEILTGQPYKVIERIGHGGMGAVFMVRNLEPGIDRLEAVKIRRPEARDDEQFRERFLREIATLAQLRHPGLTTVFRSGESAEGYLWFSMEYLDGKSLADLTGSRQPPLAPERVLDITRQLCTTLQFIHAKARLHRDLKPANVMVCDDGSVRLLDFGIARPAGPATTLNLTRPGENPHTPDFAAPEQVNGGPVDERTDLYGFGRIVNAMIRPVGGATVIGAPRFSHRLLDLVDDMLSFDQKDRPESASAVAEKLGQIEPGSPGFWGKDRNPFRGLHAYQPEHSEIFFGRSEAIRRGLEILKSHQSPTWNGFLLITGASGSGKSSLARAGLGPALLRGDPPRDEGNKALVPIICDLGSVRPESDCLLPPLARMLAAGCHNTEPAAIMAALRDANADVGQALGLSAVGSQSAGCCVILDQFEHFFLTDQPRSAQTRFLTAIARLAGTPGIAVLITLRSDCYHQCEAYPILMELKDGRHLDVAPPQSWEIAAMLRLSARASNLVFESGPDERGLEDVLLEHARRNPQALPLLSYVLDQLWEHRDTSTGTLRFADFEALGEFEGAIAEKARTTFETFAEDFPTEAAGTLDELLHLVVEAGDSGNKVSFVRRRAVPEELAAATPAVRQLAERLVAARLLVHDSSGVTLAHDALLSETVVGRWDDLRKWLEASTQNLLIRERVAQRCRDWTSHARSSELLLPAGSLLSDAAVLLRTKPSLFDGEQRFFIAQAETTAKAAARSHSRRRRLAFSSLAALTLVAILAALWATQSERSADEQRRVADAEKSNAQTQEQWAQQARNTAEGLITSMLFDLRDKLETLGRVELLDDVSKQAEIYFKHNPPTTPVAKRNEGVMQVNRGIVLRRSGNRKGASAAFEESIAIFKRLAEDEPSNPQTQADLTTAYSNLGMVARDDGNLSGARAAFEHAFDFAKQLAEAVPSDQRAQMGYGTSIGNLGMLAKIEGNLKDARSLLEQSTSIIKRVIGAFPFDNLAQLDFANSLCYLGYVTLSEGDLKAARGAFEDSLAIIRLRLKDDARNSKPQICYVRALSALGEIEKAEGNLKDARALVEEGLVVIRKLIETDPRDRDLQGQMIDTLGTLGAVEQAEGNMQGAIAVYTEIHAIAKLLAEAAPGNAQKHNSLVRICMTLKQLAQAQGDSQGAEAAQSEIEKANKQLADASASMEALAKAKQLADAEPSNLRLQKALFNRYKIRANLAQDQGDQENAREANENCRDILLRAMEASPTDAYVQDELCITYWSMGEGAKKCGDPGAAREAFEKCLSLRTRMLETRPDETIVQENLGSTSLMLAAFLQDTGDLAAASAAVEKALQLRQRLAKENPTDPDAQRALLTCHFRLGELANAAKDNTLSVKHLLECFEILHGMEQSNMPLDSKDRQMYEQLKAHFDQSSGQVTESAGNPTLLAKGWADADSQSRARQRNIVSHARFLPGSQGKYVVAQADGLFIQQTGHPPEALWAEGSAVLNVVFNRDGSLLGGVAADGAAIIRRRPPATEQLLCKSTERISPWGLSIGPDGSRWISVNQSGKTLLREFPSDRIVATLFERGANGIDICFSPDGKWIIGTDRSDTCKVVIWDGRSGEKIRELAGHTALVFRVACSPMSDRVATASRDNTVRIWDLATGEALTVLRGHAASIPGVGFRPDGQELITASGDGTARVWTLAGKERLILPVAKAPVFHASFSPNGKLIATYSNDLKLRLWDAATGQCLSTANCKTSFLEADMFSPDGMSLVVPFGGGCRIVSTTGEPEP